MTLSKLLTFVIVNMSIILPRLIARLFFLLKYLYLFFNCIARYAQSKENRNISNKNSQSPEKQFLEIAYDIFLSMIKIFLTSRNYDFSIVIKISSQRDENIQKENNYVSEYFFCSERLYLTINHYPLLLQIKSTIFIC